MGKIQIKCSSREPKTKLRAIQNPLLCLIVLYSFYLNTNSNSSYIKQLVSFYLTPVSYNRNMVSTHSQLFPNSTIIRALRNTYFDVRSVNCAPAKKPYYHIYHHIPEKVVFIPCRALGCGGPRIVCPFVRSFVRSLRKVPVQSHHPRKQNHPHLIFFRFFPFFS